MHGGGGVMGGSDIPCDPHLEGQILILTSQRQPSFSGPKFVALMEDQVARTAPQNILTIDSTRNQNPRIVRENLGCYLCHLTLNGVIFILRLSIPYTLH